MSIEKYFVKPVENWKYVPSTCMVKASICFDCQRACGGCSWSEIDPETGHPRFQPIQGWAATTSYLYSTKGKNSGWISTYRVTDCPLFVRDEPRELMKGEATEEQIKVLLKQWLNQE